MSRYAVVGPPYPGIDARYRGPARDLPVIVEALGLTHHANQALLKTLEQFDVSAGIPDLQSARELARQYRTDSATQFEIIELVAPGELPSGGTTCLGYDVTVEGGLESLLAALLLWHDDRRQVTDEDSTDVRVDALRHKFLSGLNASRLFPSTEDAEEFLRAASESGRWEGPDVTWEVQGIWEVGPTTHGALPW